MPTLKLGAMTLPAMVASLGVALAVAFVAFDMSSHDVGVIALYLAITGLDPGKKKDATLRAAILEQRVTGGE